MTFRTRLISSLKTIPITTLTNLPALLRHVHAWYMWVLSRLGQYWWCYARATSALGQPWWKSDRAIGSKSVTANEADFFGDTFFTPASTFWQLFWTAAMRTFQNEKRCATSMRTIYKLDMTLFTLLMRFPGHLIVDGAYYPRVLANNEKKLANMLIYSQIWHICKHLQVNFTCKYLYTRK